MRLLADFDRRRSFLRSNPSLLGVVGIFDDSFFRGPTREKAGIARSFDTADTTDASIRDRFDIFVKFWVLPNPRFLVGVTVPYT